MTNPDPRNTAKTVTHFGKNGLKFYGYSVSLYHDHCGVTAYGCYGFKTRAIAVELGKKWKTHGEKYHANNIEDEFSRREYQELTALTVANISPDWEPLNPIILQLNDNANTQTLPIFFYHNGTGTNQLRPCEVIQYHDNQTVKIRPSGHAPDHTIIINYALLFYRDHSELIWPKGANHKTPTLPPDYLNNPKPFDEWRAQALTQPIKRTA